MVRYLGNLEDPMALSIRDELKRGESWYWRLVLDISQPGIIVNSK
jgi:hypothetical protein